MKSWSQQFEVRKVQDDTENIYQFERLGKGCLSYLVIGGERSYSNRPKHLR